MSVKVHIAITVAVLLPVLFIIAYPCVFNPQETVTPFVKIPAKLTVTYECIEKDGGNWKFVDGVLKLSLSDVSFPQDSGLKVLRIYCCTAINSFELNIPELSAGRHFGSINEIDDIEYATGFSLNDSIEKTGMRLCIVFLSEEFSEIYYLESEPFVGIRKSKSED